VPLIPDMIHRIIVKITDFLIIYHSIIVISVYNYDVTVRKFGTMDRNLSIILS
jgi:hypothetical protein